MLLRQSGTRGYQQLLTTNFPTQNVPGLRSQCQPGSLLSHVMSNSFGFGGHNATS